MSVFDLCNGTSETWHAFYTVACLCDQPADMAALCTQARQALGADWPWDAATTPKPYDIFCKMCGVSGVSSASSASSVSGVSGVHGAHSGLNDNSPRGGFDSAARDNNAHWRDVWQDVQHVRGYDSTSCAPYAFIDWGRVELVGRATM